MCGRYTLTNPDEVRRLMLDTFSLDARLSDRPRYNIAPSQKNAVIAPGAAGGLALTTMSWGLVPFWDKSEKPKFAPINARSEDVLQKPTFRQSIQRRRCAVLADGFYEWGVRSDKSKQPYYLSLRGHKPFAIAGIYESATETRPASYCLLTTRANAILEGFHDRMPVMLRPDLARAWLEPGELTDATFAPYREPYDPLEMQVWPVSPLVNKPANDAPACILPLVAEA